MLIYDIYLYIFFQSRLHSTNTAERSLKDQLCCFHSSFNKSLRMVAAIKTVLNLYLKSSLTGTKETVLNFIHPYCLFLLRRCLTTCWSECLWDGRSGGGTRTCSSTAGPTLTTRSSRSSNQNSRSVSCSSSKFVQCISKLASILRLFLRYESISIAKVFPPHPRYPHGHNCRMVYASYRLTGLFGSEDDSARPKKLTHI